MPKGSDYFIRNLCQHTIDEVDDKVICTELVLNKTGIFSSSKPWCLITN